jgi:hypothetical protein
MGIGAARYLPQVKAACTEMKREPGIAGSQLIDKVQDNEDVGFRGLLPLNPTYKINIKIM